MAKMTRTNTDTRKSNYGHSLMYQSHHLVEDTCVCKGEEYESHANREIVPLKT